MHMSRFFAASLFALLLLLANGCAGGGSGGSTGSGSNNPPPAGGDALLMTYTSPRATVYDRVHKQLFVSVTDLNRVDVFSTVDYHLVAGIPVPGPSGMDITADEKQVVVGSATQEMFIIDTGALQVIRQVPIPLQVSGNSLTSFQPTYVASASNGKFFFVAFQPNVSGIGSLGEWNPSTGQFTYRSDLAPLPAICLTTSLDHTKMLVGSCGLNISGSTAEVALYDAASDTFSNFLYGSGRIEGMAANPNGTQFAVDDSGSVLAILDGNFNIIKQIQSSSIGLTAALEHGRHNDTNPSRDCRRE